MYNNIAVPVDLAHLDAIEKALSIAADLANHYGSTLTYIGVTTATPTAVAHTPSEFAEKLQELAASEARARGHSVAAKAYVSHDPSVDLDQTLLAAVKDVGADLVVMASHIPGRTEIVWPSHGGSLAAHSDASVLVVR